MKEIEVTIEVTKRISSKYKVTEKQYNQILAGDMPFYDDLIAEADSLSISEAETDYAVIDEAGHTVIDWNR